MAVAGMMFCTVSLRAGACLVGRKWFWNVVEDGLQLICVLKSVTVFVYANALNWLPPDDICPFLLTAGASTGTLIKILYYFYEFDSLSSA